MDASSLRRQNVYFQSAFRLNVYVCVTSSRYRRNDRDTQRGMLKTHH